MGHILVQGIIYDASLVQGTVFYVIPVHIGLCNLKGFAKASA